MNDTALQPDMITITLPDGSTREYTSGVTGFEVAEPIGPGLLKAAVAMKVDGEQQDLSHSISCGTG